MRFRPYSWFILSVIALFSTQATAREHVGLVLSGGGAKGAAHIGVYEVLEANRIPVDVVTGTSMGAYVGGMIALGYSAEEIKARTFAIDWNRGYSDRPSREELTLRDKRSHDEYQIQTDIGLSPNGTMRDRPGAVLGQTMAVLLRQAVGLQPAVVNFDQLAIPYRAVATNIETVEPVILDGGDLAIAMQASMSVPGALKPVVWHGQRLVDGGIVNNMPVDIAKELGADIIIAVDLRDSLLGYGELNSAINVVTQLTTHMTNSGTDVQRRLLKHGHDVYLTPDVDNITAPEFNKMQTAYESGKKAAQAMLPALLAYQLSEQDYAVYRQQLKAKHLALLTQQSLHITTVKFDNQTKQSDEALVQLFGFDQQLPQTQAEIEKRIRSVYALNDYETIRYQIRNDDQGNNHLEVQVVEKSWGPGYLNFRLAFEDDFDQRSNHAIGAEYVLHDITRYGGQWSVEASLGSWKSVATDFYLPFDYQREFYAGVGASFRNENRQFYLPPDELLEFLNIDYSQARAYSELGWNWHRSGSIAVGIEALGGRIDVDALNQSQDYDTHGAYVTFRFDDLDNVFFPSKGSAIDLTYGHSRTHAEALSQSQRESVDYYQVDLTQPLTYERHTLLLKGSFGGSDSAELFPIYVQDLGGFLNLSGFNRYELSGRYKAFVSASYRYRWFDNDFGMFSSPVYVGASIEKGNVWADDSDISWSSALAAGSVYVGIDTFLGPAYLAFGYNEQERSSLYLLFGNTF